MYIILHLYIKPPIKILKYGWFIDIYIQAYINTSIDIHSLHTLTSYSGLDVFHSAHFVMLSSL